jgi:hypothetical protein
VVIDYRAYRLRQQKRRLDATALRLADRLRNTELLAARAAARHIWATEQLRRLHDSRTA